MHHRLSPKPHRFRYGIFMLCLDLDELDSLHARLRTFSRNRWNLYTFRDDDHLRKEDAAQGTQDGPTLPASRTGDLKSEICAWLATQGVTVVDCPISGGPAGAASGKLSVMVSGDAKAIEAVRPLISLWGPTLTICGDRPGAAQVLKLTNNILFAVSLLATAEAFVMGSKGGLDPEVMLTAISAGSGNNRALDMILPRAVLTRDFNFGAALHILMKDVDLAIEQGEQLGIPMWVCQAARLVYKHAMFQGMANDDVSSMFRVIEQGAGHELPKTR